MKRILLIAVALFMVMIICSCEEETYPPDFTKENKVIEKITNSNDVSRYKITFESGNLTLKRFFYAPYSFAEMGDIISYDDGVIKVIRKEVKNVGL
jgi:hypothetical protein